MGKLKPSDKEPIINGLEWYVNCFDELSTCRQAMSLSPIPFTAIYEFSKAYSIDDFEEFLYIIRCMDEAYILFNNKKEKGKDGNTSKARNNHKGRR